ncbi:hypothetical protein BDB00DRAFT_805124 [Zychaea mexicana]|uniref:uncharacterized protein n=1 Tax=Zychaea mexicana TaxID=64656 RepID=UPI0022FDBFDA|nr:uncharacterized protein BDB00DRAFT_805124 [Zychaea mexicana]KAI9497135.1 hypothetical protein BDB00DRAFT_805124 [Zychaea mexicana]
MSHSVYLFRHIQTNQVIVSMRQWTQNRSLRQLDTVLRPPRLRKDHWRPLVAITGFNTLQSAQAVSDALLQRSQVRQLEFKTSPEHLARPKRMRTVDEKDLVEKSVVSLREALESVAPKHFNGETKLSALWEQPRFLEMKGDDHEWPAFLEHGQLELKNNRFVSANSSA